jgi:hypothetical protein
VNERVENFLGEILSHAEESVDPFFDSYGLEKNPFPTNRMIVREVLYNQDEAFQRFQGLAREVLQSDSPERRALAVVAGTGGGKTHFLRHCQYLFKAAIDRLDRGYAVVEFAAGSGKIDDLVRMIHEACDEACRLRHETDLPTALVRVLASHANHAELLAAIAIADVRNALKTLVAASQKGFRPRDSQGQFDFDVLRDVFGRWLRGAAINQTEKKYLGVFSRISTASLSVRVLREILSLARVVSVIDGVFVCLDEVESLFSGRLNLGKIQAFLQDLRFFYDEAVKEGSVGFDLLIVSASTATGANSLRERSYPVYQRLTYEGNNRLPLQPIQSVAEAQLFAHSYIDYFHDVWFEKHGKQGGKNPHALLTLQEVETAFREASGGAQVAPQGQLLDVFHRKVEERRIKR